MNIAKATNEARTAAKMTLAQLAMNTTLTIERLERIEQGHLNYAELTKSEIQSIADAVGIPVEVLFILGIEDEDIAPGRKEIADRLLPHIQDLVKEMIKR